jgi:TPR repeat protein
LAVLYALGLGRPKNHAQARHWLEKAAQGGDSRGQWQMGYFARYGVAMKKDMESAFYWLQKAAESDFYIFIAEDYRCFPSEQALERWLKKMSAQGSKFAPYELANYIQIQDPEQEARLVRRAAERGNMDGQERLGKFYCRGYGVRQDYRLAAYWLQKAAVNPEKTPHLLSLPEISRAELAHLYREGKGVPRDARRAAYWYKKSLSAPPPPLGSGRVWGAHLGLAMAYEYGNGVARDFDKAIALYKEARDSIAGELADFFLELLIG